MQYGISEGLPSLHVYSATRDRKGFLWFGHAKGVSRFDGVTFKNYNHPTMAGPEATRLTEDNQGRIWFCPFFKGQLFYIQNDTVHAYSLPNISITHSHLIFNIYGDNLLFNDLNTLYTINTKTLKLSIESLKLSRPEMYFESGKTKYILTSSAIFEVRNHTPILLSKTDENLAIHEWQFYSEFNDTLKFVSREDKMRIKYYDKKNRKFTLGKVLANTAIIHVSPFKPGLFCFNAVNGLYIVNEKDNIVQGPYFSDKTITNTLFDNEGNLWLATLDEGIIRIPNFEVTKIELQDEYVTCTETVDNATVILGTSRGNIYKKNISTGSIQLATNVKNRRIYSIINGFNPNEFFISDDAGFYHYNLKSNAITSIIETGLGHKNSIRCGDIIMIASSGCAIAISKSQKSLEKLAAYTGTSLNQNYISRIIKNIPFSISVPYVGRSHIVYLDSLNNRLYIGNPTQLVCIENGKITTCNRTIGDLNCRDIKVFNNKLILATLNRGLFEIEGTQLIPFTVLNQKITNFQKIIANSDYLFGITDKGIARISKLMNHAEILNESSGISSSDIHDIHLNGAWLFIATNSGLYKLRYKIAIANKYASRVYIDRIIGKDGPIALVNSFKLNYNQNTFTIEFSSPNFTSGKGLSLLYRLVGSDDNWESLPAGINQVQFNSLSPGQYIFEIKSINSNGIASNEVTSLSFVVLRPFYLQSWFLIGALVLLTILALSFTQWCINTERKDAIIRQKTVKLENELIQSQLSTLKSQMRPHFTFNALNSIQSFILLKENDKAFDYLNKFSRLLRSMLYTSSNSLISLESEIEMLRNYLALESLQFSSDFEFNIEIQSSIDSNKYLIPDMIIQPLVENALKHGLRHKHGQKKLMVSITHAADTLRICIKDNGIGLAASEKHKTTENMQHNSYALNNINNKLELLQKIHGKKGVLHIYPTDDESFMPGTESHLLIQFIEMDKKN